MAPLLTEGLSTSSLIRWEMAGTMAMLLAVLAGCTAVEKKLESLPDDVASVRAEREEKVLDDFERSRNTALYQAALGRWRAGDSVASESLLIRLLQRDDQHREARLLLADLYIATNKPKAAEEQLRLLLKGMPDDAQVHHSLGLLLETIDRTEEAVTHLQEATDLAPDNELYALSYEATRDDSKSPDPACAPSDPNPKRKRGIAGELPSLVRPASVKHAVTEIQNPCPDPTTEPKESVSKTVTDEEPSDPDGEPGSSKPDA